MRIPWLFVTAVLLTGSAVAQEREPTSVRQNPNIDRPITNEGTTSPLTDALQKLVAVYGPIAHGNDRPNPYSRIEPWGEPPPGNNAQTVSPIFQRETFAPLATTRPEHSSPGISDATGGTG